MVLEYDNVIFTVIEVAGRVIGIHDQIAIRGPGDEDIGVVPRRFAKQLILVRELYGLFDRCDACSGHLRVLKIGTVLNYSLKFVFIRRKVGDDNDLRHAHATHLLASGVHPKVASERLGHSKAGLTLDTYSHVLPNMQADAAALVDEALAAALKKRGEGIR